MEDAHVVLQAIDVLHNPSAEPVARSNADKLLQAWRTAPNSWRTCLLLLQPSVAMTGTARYFFAGCLRHAFQKQGDVLNRASLGQLLEQTALALLASVTQGSNAVSNQLSAALAALAVRSLGWEPSQLIPDLVMLFKRGVHRAEWQQQQQQAQPSLPADLVPVLALMHVLQSLAFEARNKQCSFHPMRRTAVINALSHSPEPMQWVHAALSVQGSFAEPCSAHAVALMQEWCQLGVAPLGLESHSDVLTLLCQRCLQPGTCKAAGDCLSDLFATCTHPLPTHSPAGKPPAQALPRTPTPTHQHTPLKNPALLHALLHQWQTASYSMRRVSNMQHNHQSNGEHHPHHTASYPQPSDEVTMAACKVLCAACTALLSPAIASLQIAHPAAPSSSSLDTEQQQQQQQQQRYQHDFMLVAEQVLQHVHHADDDVALVAADFFSNTYLPALMAMPSSSSHTQAVLHQHTPLLQHLTESLVLRTQLKPEVAAVATADARDIPEHARTVRRELAGMLRDISRLVGHTAMLQFMAALVQQGWQQLEAGQGPGHAVQQLYSQQPHARQQLHGQQQQLLGYSWCRLECALYATNMVAGRWVADTYGHAGQRTARNRDREGSQEGGRDGEEEDEDHDMDAEHGHGVGTAGSDGAASRSNESVSVSAGAKGEAAPEAHAAMCQLVEAAALSTAHGNGSCKLAGTALTLLGGLATWYVNHLIQPPTSTSQLLLPHQQQQQQQHGQLHWAASGQLPEEQAASSNAAAAAAAGVGAPASLPPLPSVLLAVLHSLKSDDAKLSRNGATTLQRLCAHEGLARHLLACHLSWVDMLVGVYQERGGMQQRAGPHEDSSTEELLLVTLCRLACLSSGTKQLLLHLAAPQVQQVQQALAELARGMQSGAAAGLTCAILVSQCSSSLDILTAIMDSCNVGGSGSCSKAVAAVAGGGAQEQVLGLLRAVWAVLQAGLKPEIIQEPGCADLISGVCAFMAAAVQALIPQDSSLANCQAPHQAALLIEPLSWAVGLMDAMQPLMLSMPRTVALPVACLEVAAALQQVQQAGTSEPGNAYAAPGQEMVALLTRLGTVSEAAVSAGCLNLMDPMAGPQMDSCHVASLLQLCCSCVRFLPGCLSPGTLELVLSATQLASSCTDTEQCRAVMEWCKTLCMQPFTANPTSPAWAQLCTWLDSTAGARVIQALLLASSGSMPSSFVLPLSTTLHHIWRGVGTDRFLRWTDTALNMATSLQPAPWQNLKPEHRAAFLQDMVSPDCMHSVPRFKRLVKQLCGGKRKGDKV